MADARLQALDLQAPPTPQALQQLVKQAQQILQ